MRAIKVYRPPGRESPFETFLSQQDPKLRQKLRWTLFRLAQAERCELKELHFKHFALERYSEFYEMREKNKILVRVFAARIFFCSRPSSSGRPEIRCGRLSDPSVCLRMFGSTRTTR